MTPHQKVKIFAEKHGAKITKPGKMKQKKSDISNTAKQKDLLIQLATDLGYLE